MFYRRILLENTCMTQRICVTTYMPFRSIINPPSHSIIVSGWTGVSHVGNTSKEGEHFMILLMTVGMFPQYWSFVWITQGNSKISNINQVQKYLWNNVVLQQQNINFICSCWTEQERVGCIWKCYLNIHLIKPVG